MSIITGPIGRMFSKEYDPEMRGWLESCAFADDSSLEIRNSIPVGSMPDLVFTNIETLKLTLPFDTIIYKERWQQIADSCFPNVQNVVINLSASHALCPVLSPIELGHLLAYLLGWGTFETVVVTIVEDALTRCCGLRVAQMQGWEQQRPISPPQIVGHGCTPASSERYVDKFMFLSGFHPHLWETFCSKMGPMQINRFHINTQQTWSMVLRGQSLMSIALCSAPSLLFINTKDADNRPLSIDELDSLFAMLDDSSQGLVVVTYHREMRAQHLVTGSRRLVLMIDQDDTADASVRADLFAWCLLVSNVDICVETSSGEEYCYLLSDKKTDESDPRPDLETMRDALASVFCECPCDPALVQNMAGSYMLVEKREECSGFWSACSPC